MNVPELWKGALMAARSDRGRKISDAKRGIATVVGERHGMWKGDRAGYGAIHGWLHRHKPRANRCEHCGQSGKTHFANISGRYRRHVGDYLELCVKCHRAFDGRALTPEQRQERDRNRVRRWRAENPEKYRAQQERKNIKRRKGVMP